MPDTAAALVEWAVGHTPTEDDLELAQRSLVDTVAVALAARHHRLTTVAATLPEAGRWAVASHVLDFDDLHMESTAHISAVVVPAVLATGGDPRAYLAGAGVMARLGALLGWPHYAAGWHATCTAGAPAAAVAAGVAMGLSPDQLVTAIALAVPAAGGVQRAFGTHAKSLQVGFAVDAGVRAANLAARGASADPTALDAWLGMVGAGSNTMRVAADSTPPAIPGGLAIKVFPCCYALQRPIAAVRELRAKFDLYPVQFRAITEILVRTPEVTLRPLVHDRPRTGLEGKFSLPYAVAAALIDDYPGFASFTDEAVIRPAAVSLIDKVVVETTAGGDGLLAGELSIEVGMTSGERYTTSMVDPPGSPARPPSRRELEDKIAACGADVPGIMREIDYASAAEVLRSELPTAPSSHSFASSDACGISQ